MGCCPLSADPGSTARWFRAGDAWPGEAEGRRVPTAVRWIPRAAPPLALAGLYSCDEATRSRWAAARYALPPCQFKEENCVQRREGGISPPTAEEREVLMGFARFHTVPACPSGDYSRRKSETEMVRISLLGNSFHTEAVAWLISHWGLAAGYH